MSREDLVRMRGAWDTRHWISIPSLNHEADAIQVERHLKPLPGVSLLQIDLASRRIRITYDQTMTCFDQILETLEEIGFPASDGWWSKKKATWFQYLDTNARQNANAPAPPCCSNPKGLDTGTPKRPVKRKQ